MESLLSSGQLFAFTCHDAETDCLMFNTIGDAHAYGLSWNKIVPADCPVPIGQIGERKNAGATAVDGGGSDMSHMVVDVLNFYGQSVGRNVQSFCCYPGPYEVRVLASYRAGTGATFLTSPVPPEATDNALLQTWSGSRVLVGSELEISYTRTSLAAVMSGDEIPAANSAVTWSAAASNGTTPYTYRWYRDGAFVAEGSTYSTVVGTSDFGLKVEVTDATWSVKADVKLIDVNGIRNTISGPATTWYSQGGGTWSVSTVGGTGPYSYDWYIEEWPSGTREWVGSGTQWSGYPGEDYYYIHVSGRDAANASHTSTIKVRGIGNENCAPVPPQKSC